MKRSLLFLICAIAALLCATHTPARAAGTQAPFPAGGMVVSLPPASAGPAWAQPNAIHDLDAQLDNAAAAHAASVWLQGWLDGATSATDPNVWATLDHIMADAQTRHLSVIFDLGTARAYINRTQHSQGFDPTQWQTILPLIVKHVQSDPALAAWSLGGDPPAPSWGVITVDAIVRYYSALSDQLTTLDPNHPITTGGISNLSWTSGIPWQSIFALPHIAVAAITLDQPADAALTLPAVAGWAADNHKLWIIAPVRQDWTQPDATRAQTLATIMTTASSANVTGVWYNALPVDPQSASATWNVIAQQTATATPIPAATVNPSATNIPCLTHYTAQYGDSITQIAARYSLDWQTLAQANPQLADPGVLPPGDSLCIPTSGKLPTTSGQPKSPSTPTPIIQPPTPTPGPLPSGGTWTKAQVQQRIREVFGMYATQALHVAQCESGFDPNAYNPIVVANGHAKGVFQIIDATWATTKERAQSPYNPEANIQAAWELFQRDGYRWFEWVCQP